MSAEFSRVDYFCVLVFQVIDMLERKRAHQLGSVITALQRAVKRYLLHHHMFSCMIARECMQHALVLA
jgi:hypothetical protein